jgi:ribosomal protein L7Ae-like RNA K-turn-binding protein
MSSIFENERDINNNENDLNNSENLYLKSEMNNNNNKISLKKTIDSLNENFDFYSFIKDIFTENEKLDIEENYLNENRFSSIFEETDHLYFNYMMGYLQFNLDKKNVIFGLKETIKSIESNRAKIVYIANNCEVKEYEKLLKELCELNNVTYLIVPTWTYLRDVLFKNRPTTSELKLLANRNNKLLKIQPKCNSAVILFSEEDIDMFKFKQIEKKSLNYNEDMDNDNDNENSIEEFDDKINENII